MYSSFFDLKHKPFQIDTDPRFLWLGEKHNEAFLTLKYGLIDVKGLLLLTGDVGTGKTTLINALLTTLDDNVSPAFIRDPSMEPLDFFKYTAHCFGMDSRSIDSKTEFLIQFENYLDQCYASNRKVLLIIDEAQRISQDLLEEIRLLSNIEKNERKQLSIFFIGQIEFNKTLLRYENRAIRQRISVNYNIETLSEAETREYIRHRLRVSSTDENVGFFSPISKSANGEHLSSSVRLPLPEVQRDIFSPEAIKAVHQYSKGYPRLINTICDRALLTGFIESCKTISRDHVEESVKELEIPVYTGSSSAFSQYQTYSSPRSTVPTHTPDQEEIQKSCKTQQDSNSDQDIPQKKSDAATPPAEHEPSVREILDEIDKKLKGLGTTEVVNDQIDDTSSTNNTDNTKKNLPRAVASAAIFTVLALTVVYVFFPQPVASLLENVTTPMNTSKIKATTETSTLTSHRQPNQQLTSETGSKKDSLKTLSDTTSNPAGIIFNFPQEATKPSQQTLDEINALAFLLAKKSFREVNISYLENGSESSPSYIGTAKFHAHFLNSYFMGKGIDSSKINVVAANTADLQEVTDIDNSGHTPIVVDIIW